MDPNQIVEFLKSLPHGGAFTASCSGGRSYVTFTAFTGVNLENIREESFHPNVTEGLAFVADNIQRRLA